MSTLSDLGEEPGLSLEFAVGGDHARDRMVDTVRVVPPPQWTDGLGEVTDTLVVTGDFGGPGGRGVGARAAEALLRELARQRAAGLAVVVGRHGVRDVPVTLRSAAARLDVPLLTTTTPLTEWRRLLPRLSERRHRDAEWHAEQLTALLHRLPERWAEAGPGSAGCTPDDAAVAPGTTAGPGTTAVPGTTTDAGAGGMQRITDWLAAALEADVLVGDRHRGVLAASPESAPRTLAPLLAGQTAPATPAGAAPATPAPAASRDAGPHVQSVALASPGPAATLWVAARRPLGDTETDLVRHAAKVLGLLDQARSQSRLRDAERAVHLSALQLLLAGEEVAAQRVMAGIAPGLLATEEVRVHVVDCAGEEREATAARLEGGTAGRALLARCPAFNHLILVDPLPGGEAVPLDGVLREVVSGRPEHLLGSSRVHGLGDVADAYAEAVTSLAVARELPGRAARAEDRADLADVVPPEPARRWAGTVLRPLLALPTGQRNQLLHTLDLALDFPYKAVSRVLGVHRNTVAHRVNRAFGLLGLDRRHVLQQAVVSAAVKIVNAHGHGGGPEDAGADADADFTAMVGAPAVREWAEELLQPVREDRRDLLRTLRVWLENDTHTEKAAAALDVSPGTVRSRLQAAAPLLRRDLSAGPERGGPEDGGTSQGAAEHRVPRQGAEPREVVPEEGEHLLSSVRPLAFALYAATGSPPLRGAWRA
ncbi:helix-turn-helix domain-containing protein [Streptomyces sp. JJ36]|uniref:helix-turn-helix domain-containing protein n=1 Tax=Streptomyces sp. JJ36 TaxID=2736645 RepID=UPI001F1AE2EB|nr:helix-turn-helix domain-containing protein [Streptomyces sp. JJ36]MCF6522300.1 helix-turn-helix domain-containing protein [Streptomyces sp. JJ36]